MIIDERFKTAVKMASANMGSQSELARRVGIAPALITKWLSGINYQIRLNTWKKLQPIIKPYLENAAIPMEQTTPEIPEGYLPWETDMDFERGSVVRLRASGRVLGIIIPFNASGDALLKLVVRESDSEGVAPLMIIYPKLALEMLDVLRDGHWLPAGKRAEA